jgi:hypothetical protein
MRYWVEPSTNGEVLTKSYYESVLSADRYTNYTINVKQTGEVDIFNIPLKVTTDASFKLTEDLGYFKQTIGTMGISGTTTAYFKNEKGGLLAYGKTSVNVVAKSINKLLNALHIDSSDDSEDVSYESEYQRCTLSTVLGECNSIADVARVGFPDGIDHTFFLKTSTGFAVNPEKRAEFSEIMVVATAQMLNYSSDSINEIIDFMDFEFDESITVYDGRISKVVMKKTGKVSEKGIESSSNEDAQVQKLLKNYKLNFTNEYLYTNFGKTTVTLPTELESYFI